MKTIIASLALAFCASANAEFVDGNMLYSHMYSENTAERAEAYWYIFGAMDAMIGVVICPPANVTGQQVFDIMGAYIAAHPKERNQSADRFVFEAMKNTFPCKKNEQTSTGVPNL